MKRQKVVYKAGDLSGYGVQELRLFAKARGLTGYWAMNKQKLIDALTKQEKADVA